MSHVSLSQAQLSLRGGGGGGGPCPTCGGVIVFRSCVSPRQCKATAHCMESGPTFRPAAAEATCSYLHRQQSESSFYKSPVRRTLSAVSERSQTAAVLGEHTLTPTDRGVDTIQSEGSHTEDRSLRGGLGQISL